MKNTTKVFVGLAIVVMSANLFRVLIDRHSYRQGLEAYQKQECDGAIESFDRITQTWRLIDWNDYERLARKHKQECSDFQALEEVDGADHLGNVLVSYDDFTSQYDRNSPLVTSVGDRIKDVLETNEATAIANLEFCPRLNRFRDEKLVNDPNAIFPDLYFACAQAYADNGQFDRATTNYEAFLDNYPEHPLTPEVKASWAQTLVAEAEQAEPGYLPPPAPSGYTDGGAPVLTIQNDSPEPLRIVFSGPEGRIEELERCESCQTHVGKIPDSCPKKGPIGTYTLQPGEYDVVVKSRGGFVSPFRGSWSLDSGWEYSHCFYIVRSSAAP